MTLEHKEVRQALIKATLELMDSGGLEAVKARPVAQAAGVSVGTIYNLVGTVDDLVQLANIQIYEELSAFGLERMRERDAMLGEGTARDRVLARLLTLADAYIDFVAGHANRWAALLAFNRAHDGAIAEDNLQHLLALIDIVGAVLRDAPAFADNGKRRLAARALWSAVHGIVSTNFYGGDQATARRRTAELNTVLLTTLVDGMFEAAR